MPSYHVDANGQRITVWYSLWNGKERIEYNGAVVSEARNLTRPVTPHEFEVDEGGERVKYEVRIAEPFGHVVRRNGVTIEEKHNAFWRYFISFGLIYLVFMILSWAADLVAAAAGSTRDIGDSIELVGLVAALAGSFLLAPWLKRQVASQAN